MHFQSELRQAVTLSIIDALQSEKLPPWRRPWSNDPASLGLATSLSTGTAYRGINQLILQTAAAKNSWNSRWFGTFNQIRQAGGSVRQGEKGTKVILWRPVERKRLNESGNEEDDSFLVSRSFSVFNVEQTSGLDRFQVGLAKGETVVTDRYEGAAALINATGADISFGGSRAFYCMESDRIAMPFQSQFENTDAFYETCFHELGHWTEHPNRLNWDRTNEGYAMGELIAELSSCLMMAELNLSTTQNLSNHAAYLKHWLEGMLDDPKYIFKAAAQASKVVDYLKTFSRTTAISTEPAEEPVLA